MRLSTGSVSQCALRLRQVRAQEGAFQRQRIGSFFVTVTDLFAATVVTGVSRVQDLVQSSSGSSANCAS